MNINLIKASGIAILLTIISAAFYSGCSSMDRKNAGKIREERIMKSKNYNG